jgi:hypothetical protein
MSDAISRSAAEHVRSVGSDIATAEGVRSALLVRSDHNKTSPAVHGKNVTARLRSIWHDHGLSIALVALFVVTMVGQTVSGWLTYNDEQMQHGNAVVSLTAYLGTGHFGEATFENWESEFLQMACYVLLTIFLFQRGSAESKRPDVIEMMDIDPREAPNREQAPWPVRRGGMILTVYENSLSIAFGLLFAGSFVLHGVTGVSLYNEQQLAHGEMPLTAAQFMATSQFWFESFQNWQSEFLSLAAMVVLSIFLRQRGSAESKPVSAPTWETGQ